MSIPVDLCVLIAQLICVCLCLSDEGSAEQVLPTPTPLYNKILPYPAHPLPPRRQWSSMPNGTVSFVKKVLDVSDRRADSRTPQFTPPPQAHASTHGL
jgi:hypothetical protein